MKASTTIPLGFEVGSGQPVAIPIRHMAVTGQTQEAGKTTTLEALIDRAELRALTFVTKRGEGAFTRGRPTAPYFREQADWRFVSSLLEAFLGERLKFERSWIMRATKGAKKLKDVRLNLRELQEKARGLNADVYMVLGEYLDELVPAIAAIQWAKQVELAAGVNVMDLASVPTSMQHLVIKSSIDWVLEHEEKTVVVVPEAWKFIPQGRGTPVRHSAMAYIRQGAALENYLWLDSQDIGGVDKELLRSVPVWILGVQREANEIKRTLSNIPATVAKPKAFHIALLELGQFYACWGTHAIKTYVQPVWMDEDQARKVAVGTLSVDQVRRHHQAIERDAAAATRRFMGRRVKAKEDEVTKAEAARLTRENDELRTERNALKVELASLRLRLEALEKGPHGDSHSARRDARSQPERDAGAHGRATPSRPRGDSDTARGAAPTGSNGHVDEALYQAIKARLLEDEPIVLKAIAFRPELIVEVKPRVLTVEGDSMKGRVVRLMAKGWFNETRETGDVRKELARTGTDPGGGGTLGIMLNRFCVDGFFVREGSNGFVLAPGVKVSERELQVS